MMNIIIFEDKSTSDLKPFTCNHASFEVKTGMYSNLDRFVSIFNEYRIYLIVREEIEEIISEKYSFLKVNPKEIPEGYCINGKVIWKEEYNKLLNKNLKSDNFLFYNKEDRISRDNFYLNDIFSEKQKNKNSLKNIQYLWDAIDFFEDKINEDFNLLKSKVKNKFNSSSHFVNESKIVIDKTAKIRPGCILDAKKGPIIIDENVLVDIGSKIQGPVYIDKNSYVSPGAKIRSMTLIGPGCKVGGEISSSIFHANSNKVHDGFLGHSYVGEWVNIGAGTNNSNLKNNYSSIKFNFKNKEVDTKRMFLGSMIGDFVRIGISTMLNTGTYIGIGSNVFGTGFQNKFIASFSWGEKDKVEFNKFVDTCERMKKRRKEKLSETERKLLVKLYSST